ncbi:unnamed protein product [Penicillium discolor]
MGQDDIAVFVIDVVDAFLPKAEGTLQFNDAQGMPTVVRADDGTPGIIIPDSAAPDEQVVQTTESSPAMAVVVDILGVSPVAAP